MPARHAVGALRLRDGDAVTLFNGDGAEYPAILELRGKAAFARITGRASPSGSRPCASPWPRASPAASAWT
jgi:16S rRNA U1498 N3-methylase RsmE